MNVLLVKPRPENELFDLAPFFQTEPLGLEYVAAAPKARGHSATIVDLRFESKSIEGFASDSHPGLIGLACLHILDASAILKLAAIFKRIVPSAFVLAGGHASSAYPQAFEGSGLIDAICIGEGEEVLPAVCEALQKDSDVT